MAGWLKYWNYLALCSVHKNYYSSQWAEWLTACRINLLCWCSYSLHPIDMVMQCFCMYIFSLKATIDSERRRWLVRVGESAYVERASERVYSAELWMQVGSSSFADFLAVIHIRALNFPPVSTNTARVAASQQVKPSPYQFCLDTTIKSIAACGHNIFSVQLIKQKRAFCSLKPPTRGGRNLRGCTEVKKSAYWPCSVVGNRNKDGT